MTNNDNSNIIIYQSDDRETKLFDYLNNKWQCFLKLQERILLNT